VRSAGLCDRVSAAQKKSTYLARPEGAQLMLSQRSGKWETGSLDRPYGRGTMFLVDVASVAPIERSLEATGWPLYTGQKRNDEAAFVRGGVGGRGLDHPRTPG
jgi:hypothetical protein